MIPVPSAAEQDRIAKLVVDALRVRAESMKTANGAWTETLNAITSQLSGVPVTPAGSTVEDTEEVVPMTIADIQAVIESLPPLTTDRKGQGADDELEALLL